VTAAWRIYLQILDRAALSRRVQMASGMNVTY
jgi:hypothetical protein